MPTPTLVGTATTATSSSTSYTCNKPTGVALGDLLLALQWSQGTIGAVPAGWTQMQAQTTASTLTSRLAYLPAGGSEPANYTFAQTANFGGSIIIAVAGTSLAGLVSASSATASGNAVTTPTVTPIGLADLEIRFAVDSNAGGFTSPVGFTERAQTTGGTRGVCASRVLASGAATGIHNFATSGTPASPHGYTVALGELLQAGSRVFVANFAAVHRAANW